LARIATAVYEKRIKAVYIKRFPFEYFDKMKSKSWERWVVYRTKEYELNPNNFSDLILLGIVRTGVPVHIEIGANPAILIEI
jgi:hypothetical protein